MMPQQTKSGMTFEQAREVIALENKQRVTDCMDDIQKVLEKHACTLGAIPAFTPGPNGYLISAQIRVSVRDD